jgi:heptaprenyl diphosphate synthase
MAEHGNAGKTLAVLGAFCLFLSAIEYMIPKPLPFIRLGLANVPLILALSLPRGDFFSLVIIKILSQAVISGTLFSYVFLFSITGTLMSASLMFVLYRVLPYTLISFAGISAAGAFVSNISQIVLARFFILGKSAIYIAPPLIAIGVASGFALGLFCVHFANNSLWYKNNFLHGSVVPNNYTVNKYRNSKKDIVLFLFGIASSGFLVFVPLTAARIVLFLIFWIVSIMHGGKIIFTLAVFTGIVFFNILQPYGKVILQLGPLAITDGALDGALKKAATVEGLIMISKFTISPALHFPGKIGCLTSESFRILNILSKNKSRITLKNFIQNIDNMLLKAESL